ncbi:MAG: AAA family ATPase [Vicinamibacterales bacterium]
MNTAPIDELFERRLAFPDIDARSRLGRLVGIDDQRDRLTKILALLVNPRGLNEWLQRYHPSGRSIVDLVLRRPPLVVLAGDVGSGKTELAETIGDAVARQEDLDLTLFPLSLSTRGQGRVGEMTQLLSAAFDYVLTSAAKLKSSGRARGAVILLIDEADALAQSRESAQMHHEDRAGVNAFIRGIDRIANAAVPAAVIMCTNRLSALDPAVRRRAADIIGFGRPTEAQRRLLLAHALEPLALAPRDIDALVTITGAQRGVRDHGFTFSDLTQRLLPAIVLDAYPTRPVLPARALEIARALSPTPPFRDGAGS